MGTYAAFCAEVRQDGLWRLNEKEVFSFPGDAWPREDGDTREHWEFPFPSQDYCLFGFFAGVRNEARSAVLSEPRGLPEDADRDSVEILAPDTLPEDWYGSRGYGPSEPALTENSSVEDLVAYGRDDRYGYSWLSVEELNKFDYDQQFLNYRERTPAATTYREFLGAEYFADLAALNALGSSAEVRILFCFRG